MTTLKKTH